MRLARAREAEVLFPRNVLGLVLRNRAGLGLGESFAGILEDDMEHVELGRRCGSGWRCRM